MTPVELHRPVMKLFVSGAYPIRQMVPKAITLVKSAGISPTGVAYASGFADQSHFTRTFKQMTGFLPTQYQRLSR